MAHAVFMTRGIKRDVDELVKFLETRTFLLPYKDKDGKDMLQPIQGNLQPIQLWSYVFPEEHLDAVLTSLKFTKENRDRWIQNWKMKSLVEGLRLATGCERIPEFKTDKMILLPQETMTNVSIIPIGIRKDFKGTTTAGITHELL